MRKLSGYQRYALYATPPSGSALARLGAAWLGWDAESAAPAPRLAVNGLPETPEALTKAPGRYGFHGTLKAPFRLAGDDRNIETLDAALAAFATPRAPIIAPRLAFSDAFGFVSLRLSAPSQLMRDLADDCVRAFDAWRAPLTKAEYARRNPDKLPPGLRANLDEWGYPYIFEAFDLHFTLTGAIATPGAVIAALRPHFRAVLQEPFILDAVTLSGDPGDSPFEILRRYPFEG